MVKHPLPGPVGHAAHGFGSTGGTTGGATGGTTGGSTGGTTGGGVTFVVSSA